MGTDPRHAHRISLMQALFAYSFPHVDNPEEAAVDTLELQAVIAALPAIDQLLASHAPERPLADINKVDLAILRITMFEWNNSQTPKKVLIDEAVELAKEFGSDTSSRFVNGVLAKIYSGTTSGAKEVSV